MTIDGSTSGGSDRSLVINNAGTGAIIWIATNATSGAENNTIKNTILAGPGGFAGQGIIAGSGTTLGGVAEFPNSNNTIGNNEVRGVQNAAFIFGNATTLDQNWSITGNSFGSAAGADKLSFRGMLISNSQSFVISQNVIAGVSSSTTSTATMSGIQVAGNINGGSISRNEIKDIHQNNATGWGSNGIYLTAGTAASNLTIVNNFISDVASQGFAGTAATDNGYGITIAGGGGYNIYFNTVNMNTNQAAAGSITGAVNITSAVTTAGAIDLRDNIFANTQTVGSRYAVINNSTALAGVFSTINYNDYFAANVGLRGATGFPGLVDWQAETGQDANSLAVDPLFVSNTDLHLQGTSTLLDIGTPIAGVTDDFDGEMRSATTPDIGADEIAAVAMPGSLQFSSATYSNNENDGTTTVTVNRTGGSTGSVTVDYATSDGSATGGAACTAGVDYINNSGTLTFGDGVTTQTFDLTICDDVLAETDETVNYELTNPTGGAALGSPSTAVQTIVDNEPPAGAFSIDNVRVTEPASGMVNATFTVTYTGDGVASIDYATANGTAVAGVDYGAANGTLNFGNVQKGVSQTRTFLVAINSDVFKEANETFAVNLTNPVNGSVSDSQGIGIIVDKDRSYISDFDNDKLSDYSVYRPSTGTWYVLQSTNGLPKIDNFGQPGDIAVPGDYDGDGITDRAIYRPSEGSWYVVQSQGKVLVIQNFGLAGDKPVQGDYDGDGKTDYALFRPSNGVWYLLQSTAGLNEVQFGLGTDVPVTGDFDGDARNDFAVFREGVWYTLQSSNSAVSVAYWGSAGDKPVSGDFDGDGRTDFSIYRDGIWWILQSLSGDPLVVNFGLTTDITVPGDFDGDGTTDISVFRPSTGDWYVLKSSDFALTGVNWGIAGDVPIPTAYSP